ncbi:hypothetical protein ACQP2X_36030 [Actinoplanes sp. CA-131856]
MNDERAVLDDYALRWLQDVLGRPLLAYVLNCTTEDLNLVFSEHWEHSAHQLRVLQSVYEIIGLPNPHEDFEYTVDPERLVDWLMEVGQDGRTRAWSFHQRSPADDLVQDGEDQFEQSMVELALSAYPALLLPSTLPSWVTSDVRFLADQRNPRFERVLRSLPQWADFVAAAEADVDVRAAFSRKDAGRGLFATMYLNTGHGRSVWLDDIASLLLRAAWRRARATFTTTESGLAANALEQLAIARRIFRGRTSTVVARVALTGVLLPEDCHLDLGHDGIIRPASEEDRRLAPTLLRQQLHGASDDIGNRVTINYDGDLVLDFPFPYKAWLAKIDDDIESWQSRVPPPQELELTLLRVRASILLACERTPRVHVVPTWQYVDEPFNDSIGPQYQDPRIGSGLVPAILTHHEVESWRSWYRLLGAADVRYIELALTRVLKATAERREPGDVLIDSVIAWEKLFGTSEGEPTFRVTSCLAKLLKPTLSERRTFRTELAKIYSLRSSVVHGNRPLKETEFPLCYKALDVAIDAIKALVDKRSDLLAEPDGASRSTALLLA